MEDLSAAVVHDVKNLLAELALRLEARGDAPQEMEIALDAARRLTGLLLAQRDAAGLLHANIDSADPAGLVSDLAEEYRSRFPDLLISAEADAAPPYWFYDAALVRMALGNAVHNACRHGCSKVRLSAGQRERQLVFEIADDGIGFPQEMIAAAGVLPAAVSRGGTGLGLYLARKIAGLHALDGRQGKVVLVNDGGGVFQLWLP